MSQFVAIPDMDAPDGLSLVEHMTSSSIALVGSGERYDQIQLRAAVDHPAHATKNSIHFAKSPEPVDVDRLQARGLREQFLVCHVDFSPHWWSGKLSTTVVCPTQKNRACDFFPSCIASCASSGQGTHVPVHTNPKFARSFPREARAVDAPKPASATALATIQEFQ